MKLLLSVIFSLIVGGSFASNYYFSVTGSDSRTTTEARSINTPWQSITKLNAQLASMATGDSVLFKAGESFTGSITANAKAGIIYGRYGTGADPVINGYTTLNGSFTLSSGNIYYATLDVPFLKIVSIDGTIKGMGRYPNTGYIVFTSHGESTVTYGGQPKVVTVSATGTGIGSIPFNPAGATAILRKARYYMDGQLITSRSGNTLNLDWQEHDGWGFPGTPAQDNNGLFLEDHLGTLDIDGEWYYDRTAKRFYLYSTTNPNNRIIKVGGVQVGAQASGASNLSFNHLRFTGFNEQGILIDYSSGIKANGCSFEEIGGDGIRGIQGNGSDSITNNGFNLCQNSGMMFFERNTQVITGNNVTNIALIAGMAKSGDAAGNAIHFHGDNIYVAYNNVNNIGFNGISSYQGSNWTVEYNYVANCTLVKDDGGLIYQYGISPVNKSNRIIRHNVLINAPGNYDSGLGYYAGYQAYGQGFSIYLDAYTDHVTLEDNFMANASGGGILNGMYAHDNTFNNNTVYNGGVVGIMILDMDGINTHDLNFSNNTVISTIDYQAPIYIELYGGAPAVNNYGSFTGNTYSVPFDPTKRVVLISDRTSGGNQLTSLTLSQWKSNYTKDISSNLSTVTATNTSSFKVDYNGTNSPVTVTLPNVYKNAKNTLFSSGSIVLTPYTGSVLFYSGPLGPLGPKILVNGSGKVILNNNKILTP